jgi:bifunctional ADP-heptose synthase (sugar kinase/adenylyltransferase)
MAERVLTGLREYLSENDPDLVILSDYGAGTVSEDCLDLLLTMKDRLMVDTKRTNLKRFDGTALIKLNDVEWLSVLRDDDEPERHFKCMVVTGGADDTLITMKMQQSGLSSITHTMRVPTHKTDVVDVCGCGDTAMAGLAASFLNSQDPFTAVQFANAAAATVITQKRTAIADLDQTLTLLGRPKL